MVSTGIPAPPVAVVAWRGREGRGGRREKEEQGGEGAEGAGRRGGSSMLLRTQKILGGYLLVEFDQKHHFRGWSQPRLFALGSASSS